MSNEAILAKADLAVADLSSNGGLLNAEQANTFIRKLLVQPTLLAQVRRVIMNAPQRNINKIQFAKRILRAGTQGTSLDTAAIDGAFNALTEAAARAKVVTEQVQLNTKEVIAEVRLPYDVIEDNIERGRIGDYNEGGAPNGGGGIKDTIMTLMAERAAIDLEELALEGDTAVVGSDPFLGMLDGYLKQFTSNIVDANSTSVSRTLWKNGMKTLPTQYRRNRAQMGHFISTENEIEYRDTLASRETGFGDVLVNSNGVTPPVWGSGSPIAPVGLMPSASGFLTNPQNLIFGIQRQVHLETDKDIRTREFIMVLTMRIDFLVEEELAGVKYTNIAV